MLNNIELMGILNVTPDSFSDGGKFTNIDTAVNHAMQMVAEGATIIDVGGESTRPGFNKVSAKEEISRVVPVISKLRSIYPNLEISIDTQKAVVAQAALDAGATALNDIWGFHGDPEMVKVAANCSGNLFLMHNRHEVDENIDILQDIQLFFDKSLQLANENNISTSRIILDPGIGFGKTQNQNYEILNRLSELQKFQVPILLGCSRKSLISAVDNSTLNKNSEGRLGGTIATTIWGINNNVRYFRVHDIKENLQAIKIYNTIIRGKI